jgi:hypothetical protein
MKVVTSDTPLVVTSEKPVMEYPGENKPDEIDEIKSLCVEHNKAFK